jgi:hypothetical protein
VSWLLGRLWIDGAGSVGLLGGPEHGTFLLPRVAGLEQALSRFVARSA